MRLDTLIAASPAGVRQGIAALFAPPEQMAAFLSAAITLAVFESAYVAEILRAGIESILGLVVKGDTLRFNPCIPAAWPGYEMTLRYRGAVYEIMIRNPAGVSRGVVTATLDGVQQPVSKSKATLKLGSQKGTHVVAITLGHADIHSAMSLAIATEAKSDSDQNRV